MNSQQIQDQINKIDADIQAGASDAQLNVWEMQKSDLKAQLTAVQEDEAAAAEREQAKAAQIGGLKETLITILEATFPKEETVKIIGLTEYESAQQTYNQLTDQAVDEDQNAAHAAFNEQLVQKDETIRKLKQEAIDSNQAANDMNIKIAYLTEENSKLTIDNKELTTENEDLSNQLQQQKNLNITLQKQLNNVPSQPIIDITPTAPSESLSERIAQAKANSKLQLANIKSISANWVEGTNPLTGKTQVAHVNDVQEVDIPSLPQVNAEPAAGSTPQEIPTATTDLVGNTDTAEVVGAETEAPVTTDDQIKFIQSYITDLNLKLNEVSLRVYNLENKQAVA